MLLVGGSGPFARQVIEGAEHEAATSGCGSDVAELASWRVPASLAGRACSSPAPSTRTSTRCGGSERPPSRWSWSAASAAGIDEFRARLGPLAEGVLAPAQWANRDHPAEVGPTAATFARRFQARTGAIPDYPAAQAAATGWLAAEATRRGLGADEVQRWHTSTLLGAFALDSSWRQVGYTPDHGPMATTVGSTRCETSARCAT